MSGNVQKIPTRSVATTSLGAAIKRQHEGKFFALDDLDTWKKGSFIPTLRSIEGQWNKVAVGLLGGLEDLFRLYKIDTTRPLDSKKLFLNPKNTFYWESFFDRPTLLEESLFKLFVKISSLEDDHASLLSQTTSIKNHTYPTTLTDLLDTPSSYGSAGKYLGVDHKGELKFLLPKSYANFFSLTDTPSVNPSLDSALYGASTTMTTKPLSEISNWRTESLTFTGLIDTFSLSGTACDNVLYFVNMGAQASNTSFKITLGSAPEGARVAFKCIDGENSNNEKFIHADTSGGVTLMNASAPDKYQIVPPYALTFVYSSTNSSYYLTEKFEAV